MSEIFLTSDELVELTGRRRSSAQKNALRMMGVDFLIRPDGTLVVSRRNVEELLGVRQGGVKMVKVTEPNWDAMYSRAVKV